MKTVIVITKDVIKGEAITAPQVFNNVADAKRSWGKSIEQINEDNPTKVPIQDYQLFCVGTFDTETLEIVSNVEYLASAVEFIK